MTIQEIIHGIAPLPEASCEKLLRILAFVSLPKGHVLIRPDRVETSLYFIQKGIVRAYVQEESQDITFWFGQEGDTAISMKSYVSAQRGYETIELLEPCDLYRADTQQLKQLYEEDTHLANWGRKFAERELIRTEERLLARQFRTATQRYEELHANQPSLLQRVQLGYIASYLGITQVSLSRIRTEIR